MKRWRCNGVWVSFREKVIIEQLATSISNTCNYRKIAIVCNVATILTGQVGDSQPQRKMFINSRFEVSSV
jgi:hypothetical protein